MHERVRDDDDDRQRRFFAGGGEAGALVRALDWAKTPLGPSHRWPASLKTTVTTLLHSRHPMFLWWGPDLIQFYNDAYIPSFGRGKHPAAMGQRGGECWREIWPIISPQIDDVMQRGVPSWNEDHLVPIFRNDRLEEVYWTYGYSPVLDDDGRIGGTLVVCTETTSRVIAERRLECLHRAAETTPHALSLESVVHQVAAAIQHAPNDTPCALFYLDDGSEPRLVVAGGLAPEATTSIDAWIRPQLASAATAGAPLLLPPAPAVPSVPWGDVVREVFVTTAGTDRNSRLGYVVFGLSPRLPFDKHYREYLHRLGDQIGQAQARLEALHVRTVVESERNNLLEQAPVATALLLGPDHVFELANPLYRRIVGRADIIGQTYRQAFPELVGTELPRILDRVYRTGEPFLSDEMLIPLQRSDDAGLDDCYFTFTLQPLRNVAGGVYGMMVVAVDITPQVLARKSVERSQAERERVLLDLQAASQAKDEFLAMLGHELRNPLSPILTAVQLMRLRGVQGAERERAIIERQVTHVVALVDDLLDVSRITRGTIELSLERLDLADIVAKAVEQAAPLIERRRHRLVVDVADQLQVDGDSRRLAQVVANILNNAAKYTDPGGHLEITGVAADGLARLHIRDNGIGMDAQMLPRAFDTFTQGRQPSDRSQGGLGLGLAIVKTLVHAHGGTVALHSDGAGLGTECVVSLPLATSGTALVEAARSPAPATAGTGHAVLLVDDNEDAAAMLAGGLEAFGHRVEVARDAPSALALSMTFVPDVALLDLGLPVIDGYELAVRLRAQGGWQDVRFAALTGYGQQHDHQRTAAAGFAAHLVKPVDVAVIDRTIRQLGAGAALRKPFPSGRLRQR